MNDPTPTLPGLDLPEPTSRSATIVRNEAAIRARWEFPSGATMGSDARRKAFGIALMETVPRSLHRMVQVGIHEVLATAIVDETQAFWSVVRAIDDALDLVPSAMVLPTELQEILEITSTERLRWTKDGRLRSAGTRSAIIRGRIAVTFHVHDPAHVAEVRDMDLPTIWRAADIEARKASRGLAGRRRGIEAPPDVRRTTTGRIEERPRIEGWDAFAREGWLTD